MVESSRGRLTDMHTSVICNFINKHSPGISLEAFYLVLWVLYLLESNTDL